MMESFQSLCVRKIEPLPGNPPQQLPLVLSSSFSFDRIEQGVDIFRGEADGFVYSRYGNPTIGAVARRLAELEGYGLDGPFTGYMTSSGMSAIHTILIAILENGGRVLTQGNLYGGTTELFLKVMAGLGIQPVFADLSDPAAVGEALDRDPGIRVVYLETPTNPTLSCIDLEAIGRICRARGIRTVVDNTFSTPYFQRPFRFGADFVIHSTTKYLNGHGTGIAGVVIGRDEAFMNGRFFTVLKLTGATCNAFDAWLVANGLRTLPVRMDRHGHNAQALAEALLNHPAVVRVNYPGLTGHPSHPLALTQMSGFGGMLSFEVRGGQTAAMNVLNRLTRASLAPTLGDVDTLVLHPATSSHLRVPPEQREAEGITDGLIRVSVGLEGTEDLVQDFLQALEGA